MKFTYPHLRDTANGVTQVFTRQWSWMGVIIPEGFETDGTSSPWLFRWFVPRRGKYVFAAYIHDYCLTIMPRRDAARMYLRALKELGAPRYQQFIRFRGVRAYDVTLAKLKSNNST